VERVRNPRLQKLSRLAFDVQPARTPFNEMKWDQPAAGGVDSPVTTIVTVLEELRLNVHPIQQPGQSIVGDLAFH